MLAELFETYVRIRIKVFKSHVEKRQVVPTGYVGELHGYVEILSLYINGIKNTFPVLTVRLGEQLESALYMRGELKAILERNREIIKDRNEKENALRDAKDLIKKSSIAQHPDGSGVSSLNTIVESHDGTPVAIINTDFDTVPRTEEQKALDIIEGKKNIKDMKYD